MNVELEKTVAAMVENIKDQVVSRGYRVSNEMRNAVLLTMRGQRSGRRYKVPGTYAKQKDKKDGKTKNGRYYTASAPGEVPAVRTGAYKNSWMPNTYVSLLGSGDINVISKVESRQKVGKYVLGELLEDGTTRMAPRPHKDKILEKSKESAVRIYNERYFKND